ncbi:bifunctional diguanylate cyclase/phosphodiesterase [Jeotgalibacillus aurantiacus]|uniref:bifunctional diguanylate cyclase/phosphodiesterase n=1 Tax=Jeotgalibacillus aurantiacus TaxID=2763266 RepID=UPI001D0AA98A|nr:EAL domain-containing protein [Jeotgalibacillus aurantiacus]
MHHDRYSRLAEITKMIHLKLDKKSVLEQVVMAISEEIVRCDAVGIYLPIAKDQFQGFVGKPDNFNGITLDKMVIDLKNDRFAAEIVQTKKSIYIPDTSKDSRPDPIPIELFKIKSVFGMPIYFENSFYGLVFLFDYSSPLHLNKEELEAIESYVMMAAVAIRNTELFTASKKLLKDKQLLLDATNDLSRCLTLQEALETSFRYVGQALNNPNVGAHLKDIETQTPSPHRLSADSEWKEEDWIQVHREVKVNFQEDPVFKEVVATKRPLLIEDAINDPRPNKTAIERFGIRSMYTLPLISRGEVLGTLGVVSFDGPRHYTDAEQQLAISIAGATAGVLDNLIHLEQLERIIRHRTRELQEKNEILETMNNDLRLLSKKNESILNSAGEGIYGLNKDGVITFCNPTAASMLAYDVEELVGKTQDDVIAHYKNEQELYEKMSSPIHQSLLTGQKAYSVNEKFAKKDGAVFDVEYVSTPIQNGDHHNGVVVTFRDVTERKQMEKRIHNQAYYDLITRLPNRTYLVQKIKNALKYIDPVKHRLAVMFLDLDRFKLINDSYGHTIGDRVLCEVAERFQTLVTDRITVGRLGGDEFIVLVEEVERPEELDEIAAQFLHVLKDPIHIGKHELFTGASLGISMYPDDAQNEDDLIRNADTAMYVAKEQGGTYHYFTRMLMEKNIERSNLLNALYQAVERNEMKVYYQPKVDYENKQITGVEALLRWTHPELGKVPPDKFIPLAEETGMILKIGEWVLRESLRQLRKWHDLGHNITMAVNFSIRQIQHPRVVQMVKSMLEEEHLEPKYLEIELTEHTLIQAHDIEKLHELKALGISLSLDDFGTGYSSLRYIKDFPIDCIKIDRSFVENMIQIPHIAALNSTIIHMAKRLDYRVIAEGVETKEQIDRLMQEGCHCMQGFYFSRPVPAGEMQEMFAKELS